MLIFAWIWFLLKIIIVWKRVCRFWIVFKYFWTHEVNPEVFCPILETLEKKIDITIDEDLWRHLILYIDFILEYPWIIFWSNWCLCNCLVNESWILLRKQMCIVVVSSASIRDAGTIPLSRTNFAISRRISLFVLNAASHSSLILW